MHHCWSLSIYVIIYHTESSQNCGFHTDCIVYFSQRKNIIVSECFSKKYHIELEDIWPTYCNFKFPYQDLQEQRRVVVQSAQIEDL